MKKWFLTLVIIISEPYKYIDYDALNTYDIEGEYVSVEIVEYLSDGYYEEEPQIILTLDDLEEYFK